MGRVPVLEKAPDFWMNSASADMPFLEPSMEGRNRYLEAFLRIPRWRSYLGQSRSMWFLDSRVLLSQGQEVGSGKRGMKAWQNSPVYVCPVLHWRTHPKTSCLSLRSWKCFEGLRDGWMQFVMANLPSFGEFFHLFCQSFVVAVLVLLLALDLVVLKGFGILGMWLPLPLTMSQLFCCLES